MKTLEHMFKCPLPGGLHARPASRLSDVAARFSSDITLTNVRSTATADAKSVLAIVAMDVRLDDDCRLRIHGTDADAAVAALSDFLTNVLPGCDDAPSDYGETSPAIVPPSLRAILRGSLSARPISPGIGRGTAVFARGLSMDAVPIEPSRDSPVHELQSVRRAIDAVIAQFDAQLSMHSPSTQAELLRAHRAIAADATLRRAIHDGIEKGLSAASAVAAAAREQAAVLAASPSAIIRERAIDIEDVCIQLLEHLTDATLRPSAIILTQPSVVFADRLTPRQLLAIDRNCLAALVLAEAGETSHLAILARAFGVPLVHGVVNAASKLNPRQIVLVDAYNGLVLTELSPEIDRYYEREARKYALRAERLRAASTAPAATIDARRMDVAANVATVEEIEPAFMQGADGIGLFRTEMLFLDRPEPPSEEEQFAAYANAARIADGRPVIIRTFDVGGDKSVAYLNLPREANPALGCRGVRVYLAHPVLFRTQLRAALRASAFGKIQIMAPMIATPDEMAWFRHQVTAVQRELAAAGIVFDPAVLIGMMIEVPAAAVAIDRFAENADFFSMGTNDLLQTVFCVDRENPNVAKLADALDPAFLRVLADAARKAREAGRWIGMCGEMAGRIENLPLLIGMELNEISAAARDIPALKSAVASESFENCRDLLADALGCRNAAEVRSLLSSAASHVEPPLIASELILIDADCATREEAVKQIVDALYIAGRTENPAALEEALWARESVYSTGLGHGFAIPHCKCYAVTADSIGVARLREPIDWNALDGAPVRHVILLAMRDSAANESQSIEQSDSHSQQPNSTGSSQRKGLRSTDGNGRHMQVFSRLARKLMDADFRERIASAPDSTALLRSLSEELGLS